MNGSGGNSAASEAAGLPTAPPADQANSARFRKLLRPFLFLENGLIVFILAAMVIIPLMEIILRRFQLGISGAISFVQHGTLIVGMVGGAIAAREKRLLSLSSLTNFIKGACDPPQQRLRRRAERGALRGQLPLHHRSYPCGQGSCLWHSLPGIADVHASLLRAHHSAFDLARRAAMERTHCCLPAGGRLDRGRSSTGG
jgi:hypothetical protein